MTADTAYQVLVIILSVTLAIFLVLAIIATSLIIRLLRKADKIADSAESVASDIEAFSTSLKEAAGPAAALRVIMGAAQGLRRK
jgi:hypothetical protein